MPHVNQAVAEHIHGSLGLLQERVVVIAHTETEEMIRIISVRKATKNEEISYFQQIAD